MDPLTHTLVGASLAETRLGRATARAAPTLVLGANAPDLDAVTMLVSRDVALGFRRGWTHGVLAMALLPLALAGLVLLVDRALAHRRGRPPRARPGAIVGLAYLSVLTHPLLDWLNTYGIRLLMPFDGRWFYGDALFIIDPWLWLLAGTAVVLARSRSVGGGLLWITVGAATTTLMLGVGLVPGPARALWVVGVAALLAGRLRRRDADLTRIAVVCLCGGVIYVAAMIGGSRLAAREARHWLAVRDDAAVEVMAGPVPANPFRREVLVADARHYHVLEVDWWRSTVRPTGVTVPRGPRGPVVEAALRAPHVRGLVTWMRFPAFTVDEHPQGYRVTIRDVRYAGRDGPGLGDAVVELDRDLRVVDRTGTDQRRTH